MEEILQLLRENNLMLKEILSILREHTSPEFINKENEEDFYRNVLANIAAKKLENYIKI